MKRVIVGLCVLCLMGVTSEVFAQSQSLVMEFHDVKGVGWKHREGAFVNPVSDAWLQVRKGIGGPDAAMLVGWKFSLGSFTISPWFGGNVDDKLTAVSLRPELWYAFKCSWLIASGISSPSFAIDDSRQNDWYQMVQVMFPISKELQTGVKSDGYYLLESEKLVFLQVGPRFGYMKSREDGEGIWVGVWTGWEKQLNEPFVRIETGWYF